MYRLLGLSLVVAAAAMPQPKPSAVVAFTNVSVLPMDRETVLSGQTVVIRDGKIAELGAAAAVRVPDGAVSVDGQGKFLMPTLAEMHAHIPAGNAADSTVERTLFLYAANGLGTIRGMLGDPRHLQYRERVAKGELFSPRIYTSGPSFNAKSATSPEVAAKMVQEQKAAGYDLLKIHPGVSRAAFDALDAKADELKIPFAGHVPLEVGLQRALEAKYHSIDHLDGYVEALAKEPLTSQFFGLNLINQVDESKISSLVAATKAAGVWQVPTQVLMDSLLSEQSADEMAKWPEMKYVPAETLKSMDRPEERHFDESACRGSAEVSTPPPQDHEGSIRRRRAVRAGFGCPAMVECARLLRASRAQVAGGRRVHAFPGAADRHRQPGALFRHLRVDRHRRPWHAGGSAPARRQPAHRRWEHHEDRRRHAQRPVDVAAD